MARSQVLRTLVTGGCLCVSVAVVRADDIGTYPLDHIARTLEPGEPLPCTEARGALVVYRGERVRYHRSVRVHTAFVPRLRAFEEVVAEVATEVYGRAPRRLRHLGTHNCRRMRRYPDWVSEHALGNAIDVAGFDFGRLRTDDVAPPDLPRALKRGFAVRVERHWNGKRGASALHRHFLHTLAQRLTARRDIFRTLLGPAWPGHHNHFHFDCAPYRVIEIFEQGG